jgi:hypothetical protein
MRIRLIIAVDVVLLVAMGVLWIWLGAILGAKA